MEDQRYSGDLGNIEAIVDRDFWEALVKAEGVNCTWQADEEPVEASLTVEANPDARIAYPWNPMMPESEAFFMNPATPTIFDGWQTTEVVERANAFFNHMNQLWAVDPVEATLMARFAARVPQAWLAAIAQRAQQVVANAQTVANASLTLSDQLVQCVQDMVPGLAEDDFYVLARPLAVQMRNGGLTNPVDAQIAQVPQVEWEQLSDVQRARLGLAIARYAIEIQSANR